jgi:hypothetical protein
MERWFVREKPKVRNKAPEKEQGQLKVKSDYREVEASEIDTLLLTNQTKR